ncbi:FAD-dependent oxidoreductase [Youngiibacter multivorans]|uniref:NADPH-dependent 2,4-dienoyl-CoA reductase/sulfur reductase-like enzyme n=1 Tax=Youngiibacter multivorans TaxID=937251 RepID=A0ABS4G659_9CLOT|nr:FAD-dependent oxidoreductase [Youngiibacter multivorans]MBP1920016.1 NADPH-dependent 2,4-dienoyl-CoA reductase/sulfur reductase-like enzyme [Youngiibacter multivorans]
MRLVVIGAVAAGLSGAYSAMKNIENLEVIVLEKGTDVSYGACGMPYLIGGAIDEEAKLIAKDAEEILADGIDLRLRHEAVGVDFSLREVYTRSLDTGEDAVVPYDFLLIGTGANAVRIPGTEGIEGVFTLNTLEDSRRIKSFINEKKVKKAVIVGGGYKGVEMLEALHDLGIKAEIIEMEESILNTFDPDVSAITEKYLRDEGFGIHLGEKLDHLETDSYDNTGERVSKVVTDKSEYEAELVILALGVRPATGFLEGTNLTMTKGAIVTDLEGRTNVPGVYAAGDCAMIFDFVAGVDRYLPLGTNSNKMGKLSGLSMAGKKVSFKGVQSSGYVKILGMEQSQTGMTDTAAKKMGLDFGSVLVRTRDKSSYYPDSRNLYVKLTYLNKDGRLIGAQMAGETGTAIRIQGLVPAIYANLTVYDLEYMDFGYAPPFNSVWDSINVAASKAARNLPEQGRNC